MGGERLPRRVIDVWGVGWGYGLLRGGQNKDWMVRLEEEITEFGTRFKGQQKAAQKAGS